MGPCPWAASVQGTRASRTQGPGKRPREAFQGSLKAKM